MALQIEAMEPRNLLSGLTPVPITDHTPAAPHALVKLQGGSHTSALAGPSHSSGVGSKASSPDAVSKLFQNFATFPVRFNGAEDTAEIGNTRKLQGNETLTVTPIPLNDGTRSEVLDLDFQTNTARSIFKGNEVKFGPFGNPKVVDKRIPILQKAKLTSVFMYFTTNYKPVENIKFAPGLFYKIDDNPIPNTSGKVFFVSVTPQQPAKDLFVFNNDPWVPKKNDLGVPPDATGLHIDLVVTPA